MLGAIADGAHASDVVSRDGFFGAPGERTDAAADERFAEDQAMLKRFREGDRAAYGELFARYRRLAVGYARRYTNNAPDAEDLAQDAFARVLQALRRGQGPTVSMRHYLLTAIRTIATDGFRRKIPQEYSTEPDELALLYEREHYKDDVELADWVVEGFNSLSERQQKLVWNHAVEEQSLTAIAPELQISVSSASRDYARAMTKLRKTFAESAALASGDPNCDRFANVLGERDLKRSPEARAHVRQCESCRAVVKRLHSKDYPLLSLIVVSGLGTLGWQALTPVGTAAAAASFAGALPSAAKATAVGVGLVAAVGMAAFMIATLSGDGAQQPGPHGAALDSAAGDNTVIASTASCEVRREAAGERREVWQLLGGEACSVTVQRELPSGARVPLLDAGGPGVARGIEIVRGGTYEVSLSEPGEATTVSVAIRTVNAGLLNAR